MVLPLGAWVYRGREPLHGYDRVILRGMKTAVSIPDELFRSADLLAGRLGLTRSEVYARALERYLREQSDAEVTAALDDVYAQEPSTLDAPLAGAQARAIRRTG